jgi:hypothetical protein
VKNITSDVRVIKSTRCTRVSIASMRVGHCSVDERVRGGVLCTSCDHRPKPNRGKITCHTPPLAHKRHTIAIALKNASAAGARSPATRIESLALVTHARASAARSAQLVGVAGMT